jgi:hypothetical protein
MAFDTKPKFSASAAMTISLAALASSTSGAGRQSTLLDNSTTRYKRIHVWFLVTTGTSPTANRSIRFFLVKGDDPASSAIRVDNAGASDAAITIVAADQLYSVATSNASNTGYRGSFVIENPGPEWGLAVVHDTAVNLHATAGNHIVRWVGEIDETVEV